MPWSSCGQSEADQRASTALASPPPFGILDLGSPHIQPTKIPDEARWASGTRAPLAARPFPAGCELKLLPLIFVVLVNTLKHNSFVPISLFYPWVPFPAECWEPFLLVKQCILDSFSVIFPSRGCWRMKTLISRVAGVCSLSTSEPSRSAKNLISLPLFWKVWMQIKKHWDWNL